MADHTDLKLSVLKDLMDHMRDMDGGKLKPKAVEVSVSSKPELAIDHLGGEPTDAPTLEGHSDETAPEMGHDEPDGDDLSPEDLEILGHLFGDKEQEG